MTQVAAVKATLDQVALALLDDHVRHTVSAEEGDLAVTDVLDAVARLLRTEIGATRDHAASRRPSSRLYYAA